MVDYPHSAIITVLAFAMLCWHIECPLALIKTDTVSYNLKIDIKTSKLNQMFNVVYATVLQSKLNKLCSAGS